MFGTRTTELAKQCGAESVFFGQLGDQLFCRSTGLLSVVDSAWSNGMGRQLLEAASDVCRITGAGIWAELIRGATQGYLTRRRMPAFWKRRITARPQGHRFISDDALREHECWYFSDWMRSIDNLPVGKLRQIAEVAAAQAYYAEFGAPDEPEWMMPLACQPLMELCLRTPTYLHITGGWERSVERHAFAKDVPTDVIWRRTKGSTARQRENVFRKNRLFISSMLLDGLLMKRGLLRREAVEKYLRDDIVPLNSPELIQSLKIECWLQVWRTTQSGQMRESSAA
jgi:asparagine synthase (glutamine-hydrolysing)